VYQILRLMPVGLQHLANNMSMYACGRAWWTYGRTRLTCSSCIILDAGMASAATISRKAPGETAGAPWRMQSSPAV